MDFDQVAVNGANSNHIKKGGVIMASTIYDVATRAGLSVGAISKYINAGSLTVEYKKKCSQVLWYLLFLCQIIRFIL